MKMSRRASRMERHHKRNTRSSINLVSLMDIFTILVFFLLVNSSNVNVLPSTKELKLPKASAEQLPKETLVIVVNQTDILLQGRHIASIDEVMTTAGLTIIPLKKELEYQASRSLLGPAAVGPDGLPEQRDITIMGDKKIPYALLKKIMVTCSRANYGNISLAVAKKVKEKG
ncbi:MAG: biopolymer transporter ExbD [Gammaproteobacteria bacterium]|nr:biopolymer transporter ExbD [Gammaproteobacteria bacterium]